MGAAVPLRMPGLASAGSSGAGEGGRGKNEIRLRHGECVVGDSIDVEACGANQEHRITSYPGRVPDQQHDTKRECEEENGSGITELDGKTQVLVVARHGRYRARDVQQLLLIAKSHAEPGAQMKLVNQRRPDDLAIQRSTLQVAQVIFGECDQEDPDDDDRPDGHEELEQRNALEAPQIVESAYENGRAERHAAASEQQDNQIRKKERCIARACAQRARAPQMCR